jgi:hypothetical protein
MCPTLVYYSVWCQTNLRESTFIMPRGGGWRCLEKTHIFTGPLLGLLVNFWCPPVFKIFNTPPPPETGIQGVQSGIFSYRRYNLQTGKWKLTLPLLDQNFEKFSTAPHQLTLRYIENFLSHPLMPENSLLLPTPLTSSSPPQQNKCTFPMSILYTFVRGSRWGGGRWVWK